MNIKNTRNRNAFYLTLYIVLGNSFGIWFTYIIIKFIFNGIVADLTWPGISSFVTNGSFLIMTFSILTTILEATTVKFRINKYNGLALVLVVVTTFIYIRCIGLNGNNFGLLSGYLPFIFSTILLYFSLRNHTILFRNYSWLQKARNQSSFYDIFLSYPIGSNNTTIAKESVQTQVSELSELLLSCGYKSIFNASKYFLLKEHKNNPAETANENFMAVDNSKNFIFYFPEKVPSSALMELGYAIRDKKNILILTKDSKTLPFLARGMAEIHDNIRTIYFEDFNNLLNIIKKNHLLYFEK